MGTIDSIQWKNLDACSAFTKLKKVDSRICLDEVLDEHRINSYSVPAGAGLTYNYAAKAVDDELLNLLAEVADEQQLTAKYGALLNGARINTGEDRRVLHHLVRGQLGDPVVEKDRDLGAFYRNERERFARFATDVHEGRIKGSTGETFTTVVQIGIGGSDLGPRALHLALVNYAAENDGQTMEARFISNVDPDDPNNVLRDIDFERTLFIVVSKSGTTQETLTNRQFVLERIKQATVSRRSIDPAGHMIAVTSRTSPMARSSDYLDAFFIDDYIGGRYSSTSAVGGVVLSLAYGPQVFEEVLAGAHEADAAAQEHDPRANAALMDALIGMYERNVLGMPVTAVLPYSQALARFPAHLQQLDMESNGKSVNREGKSIDYATGPVVFGEPGTNGQHSFYQLLHQGTDVVPLQFIGFQRPQTSFDVTAGGSTSRRKLNANLAAQIIAFAKGKEDSDRNKHFPGNRPAGVIVGRQLTPRALGALLAHFENKVMFQGFLWNINSFDQEGVQLGKSLTGEVLSGSAQDPALTAYVRLLGAGGSTSSQCDLADQSGPTFPQS